MATTKIGKAGGSFTGTQGSDTWEFTAAPAKTSQVSIDGLTSANDHGGVNASKTVAQAKSNGKVADALLVATDRKLAPFYRPKSPADTAATATGTDTNSTSIAGYNAKDVILFSKSGDYTSLGGDFFTNIETFEFGSGVSVRLSADIFENIGTYADSGALNTGSPLKGSVVRPPG